MYRFLYILIVFVSFSSIAQGRDVVVLIPGAASAGDKVYIKNISRLLGGFGNKKVEYFKTVKDELEARGFKTDYCIKNGDRDRRSLTERAAECRSNLLKLIKREKSLNIHLLGHSMGGLIARKLFKHKTISNHIKSITTISTPHKGSMLARYALKSYKNKSPIGLLLRSIEFTPQKRYLKELEDQLYSQVRVSAKEYKVAYSISNYRTNWYNTPLQVTSKVLEQQIRKYQPKRETLNDGIIETSSMSYGKSLGVIEADHMESVCVLYSKKSTGCRELKSILIKHFQSIYKK